MKKPDLHTRLSYALAWIRGRTDAKPKVGLILGSGLSSIADRLARPVVIAQAEIPEFPIAKVPGHPGRLVIGELAREPGSVVVAAMQGRVHAYEGWSPEEVGFGIRVLRGLGIEQLIVTNASGGVNPAFRPGDLVRITDHLNLSGQNPLVGENDDRLGPRFPDLSQAYDVGLGEKLSACALRLGIDLKTGVYAYVLGPSYETPAEVKMLRALGADCVGMSTVPEVIVARHAGLPVCGISIVTNRASGLTDKSLSHAEVEETAKRAKGALGALLSEFILASVQ
jgi:purine-nucleoside phosphorylase